MWIRINVFFIRFLMCAMIILRHDHAQTIKIFLIILTCSHNFMFTPKKVIFARVRQLSTLVGTIKFSSFDQVKNKNKNKKRGGGFTLESLFLIILILFHMDLNSTSSIQFIIVIRKTSFTHQKLKKEFTKTIFMCVFGNLVKQLKFSKKAITKKSVVFG